nr:uv radiation resistance associated protein [Quercus suber]
MSEARSYMHPCHGRAVEHRIVEGLSESCDSAGSRHNTAVRSTVGLALECKRRPGYPVLSPPLLHTCSLPSSAELYQGKSCCRHGQFVVNVLCQRLSLDELWVVTIGDVGERLGRCLGPCFNHVDFGMASCEIVSSPTSTELARCELARRSDPLGNLDCDRQKRYLSDLAPRCAMMPQLGLHPNHKLRNLVSISLRNLALTSPYPPHPRGKTIDDDALPRSLRSPAKNVLLREKIALGHSRSSVDLRSVAEHSVDDLEAMLAIDTNGSPVKGRNKSNGTPPEGLRTLPRPSITRVRRRSTLEWINATPQRRQERLEDVTADRMADVFFSLHVEGVKEPIYISELVERTMNPTFRHIDFSACGPGITRLDRVTLKVWVNGNKLDHVTRPLPQNAIILNLTDGLYTTFDWLAEYESPPHVAHQKLTNARSLLTSSFDALLRLAKLDDSIQDALATRNRIATDLESLLRQSKDSLTEGDGVAETDDRLKTIEFAKKTVEKQLEKARKQQDEKRESLRLRRELMAADVQSRTAVMTGMQDAKPVIPTLRHEHEVKEKVTQNQRRRICEDLSCCYPISPVPRQSLAFSIRELYLPNSENLDAEPSDKIAAALGNVAHVVLLLSYYLGQPLPYPVTPHGSTSTIYDPVSLLTTNASTTQTYKDEVNLRTYPLFSKGVPRFRFDYAVFLLNSDIKVLVESVYNGRILDLRHTLPNLKYLLYVATAGEGDLPARKAGGIRGLLRSRPDLERNGSTDSASSGFLGSRLNGPVNGVAEKGPGAVDSLRKNMSKGA